MPTAHKAELLGIESQRRILRSISCSGRKTETLSFSLFAYLFMNSLLYILYSILLYSTLLYSPWKQRLILPNKMNAVIHIGLRFLFRTGSYRAILYMNSILASWIDYWYWYCTGSSNIFAEDYRHIEIRMIIVVCTVFYLEPVVVICCYCSDAGPLVVFVAGIIRNWTAKVAI